MLKINYKNLFRKKCFLIILFILLISFIIFLTIEYYLQNQLIEIYDQQNSLVIKDRNNEIIFIEPNEKAYWAEYSDNVPEDFKELLIKKEDKYFYYHPGFNPWSALKAGLGYFGLGSKRASSTINQQLVKILLEKEFKRSIKNKIIELFYALGLEIYQSKKTILNMYVNSIYFGNQSQGLTSASHLYFNISPDLLTQGQIIQLLSTISSPSGNNPAKEKNKEISLSLAEKLLKDEEINIIETSEVKENMKNYIHYDNAYFELKNLIPDFEKNIKTTIDKKLNNKIREIVKRNVEDLSPKNVQNSAVIIIKLPENEILTLIGSPDPESFEKGQQINMLTEPRPIGSTIKPFIYLKAFEKGLRPYTLVNDREYKYITAIGFPLYPKNFDYKYRGITNLHYSLSNSLNVPAVKVLEYVGLESFYKFLEEDLSFEPIQPLNNYQLGISLGALEMDLFNLGYYFTIFPNQGILKDLTLIRKDQHILSSEKIISQPEYIQLINKILSDRKTGIEQFGLKSELNLFQSNYALKTGTSRDFKDSWVMGYTPDFLVGVWLGNSDNTSMDEITGQVGAGRIWAEIMETLLNSNYNKKTDFEFNLLKEFYKENYIEYGLLGDDYEKSLNALIEKDNSLILNPHQGDVFLLENNTKIILKAEQEVTWFINNEFLEKTQNTYFIPQTKGQFYIKARSNDSKEEIISILITKE